MLLHQLVSDGCKWDVYHNKNVVNNTIMLREHNSMWQKVVLPGLVPNAGRLVILLWAIVALFTLCCPVHVVLQVVWQQQRQSEPFPANHEHHFVERAQQKGTADRESESRLG